MLSVVEITVRLFVALILGGLIGFEREIRGKEAGFKTNTLVCLGSALFMILSLEIYAMYHADSSVDPSRIASQVVTGIGFLGGGAIIRFPQGIKGLTTAAGIWVASGIGLACGLGRFVPAVLVTAFAMFIFLVFPKVEKIIEDR